MGLFTRSHRIPLATASIQCLETHDHFPGPVPHSNVCMNVCVALAENVRSGSVAVVSGIYYSDSWWLQAYLSDLYPPHIELAQPVQFYSIPAWLLYFGWYQHWWAKRRVSVNQIIKSGRNVSGTKHLVFIAGHPSKYINTAHWGLTSQPCLCSNHHSTWAH